VSGSARRNAAAVEKLDEITRRLRRECPWDREQDERSIVPHTVEEAYELADAAARGDDARILDELGDVLFQVHFLALLLEERGAGDLGAVADHCREKLIRRHPHVFGEQTEAEQGGHHLRTPGSGAEDVRSSDEVLQNWDRIKQEEEGRGGPAEPFADVPQNLPALLYARKLQRRAISAAAGEEGDPADAARTLREAADDLSGLLEQGESAAPAGNPAERRRVETALGELLLAAVDVGRRVRADPELALRAAADRFRELKDSGAS
jgi:ATP diphosphatase